MRELKLVDDHDKLCKRLGLKAKKGFFYATKKVKEIPWSKGVDVFATNIFVPELGVKLLFYPCKVGKGFFVWEPEYEKEIEEFKKFVKKESKLGGKMLAGTK